MTFVATWCESYLEKTRPALAQQCKARREQLAAARLRYGVNVNWQWVATGIWTTPADLQSFVTQQALDADVRLDETGELFERFAVREFATVLILDSDGAIRARIPPSADLKSALERHLSQPSR